MPETLSRKPVALANWKMAMTISESLEFSARFRNAAVHLIPLIDVILCPPYTSIYPLFQTLSGTTIQIGAQDLCPASGEAHTGEISARLLADVGCKWAILGHWEVRRSKGETDEKVNAKILAASRAGLGPMVFVGESIAQKGKAREVLQARLPDLFRGCDAALVSRSIVLYEPEWSIGIMAPAPADYVAGCCGFIREWVQEKYGKDTAQTIRIIYGGSVTPKYSESLLAAKDVDGLGAGRKGRDPEAFSRIVQAIAVAKGLAWETKR